MRPPFGQDRFVAARNSTRINAWCRVSSADVILGTHRVQTCRHELLDRTLIWNRTHCCTHYGSSSSSTAGIGRTRASPTPFHCTRCPQRASRIGHRSRRDGPARRAKARPPRRNPARIRATPGPPGPDNTLRGDHECRDFPYRAHSTDCDGSQGCCHLGGSIFGTHTAAAAGGGGYEQVAVAAAATSTCSMSRSS